MYMYTCVGKVISQVHLPGLPDWYNIHVHVTYENDSYRLVEDYREGNMEIVPEAVTA